MQRPTAINSALSAWSLVMDSFVDQPMICLENRSNTTARFNQPLWVPKQVTPVTQALLGCATSNWRCKWLGDTSEGFQHARRDDACSPSWIATPRSASARYAVLAAGLSQLSQLSQVCGDLAVAVDRATLQSRLLDWAQHALIISSAL